MLDLTSLQTVKLFNLRNAKAHLTLKLGGLWLCCIAIDDITNGSTTVKGAAVPAGFATLVCHQARLAHHLRGNELIVHQND